MTNNERLYGILGLCRRANKISHGHDSSVAAIMNRDAALCLVSSDASDRLYNDLVFTCEKVNSRVPIIKVEFTMDEIGMCLGAKKA
ncbi:MAG: ribosomal L7Ae/L30e/S12e/Gadd45 family protein, partial [Oscillospiraceae bacterium]